MISGGIEDLDAAIALSRLIRLTTIGSRWAARLSMVNGVLKQILAFQPRGIAVDAFCLTAIEQDWLTQEDDDQLKRLMDTSNPVSPCISECIMHIGVTNTPQQTEHLDMIYGRFRRADYSTGPRRDRDEVWSPNLNLDEELREQDGGNIPG